MSHVTVLQGQRIQDLKNIYINILIQKKIKILSLKILRWHDMNMMDEREDDMIHGYTDWGSDSRNSYNNQCACGSFG